MLYEGGGIGEDKVLASTEIKHRRNKKGCKDRHSSDLRSDTEARHEKLSWAFKCTPIQGRIMFCKDNWSRSNKPGNQIN